MNAPTQMDVENRCANIFQRAVRIGVKMTDLCNEAHVDISSFYRWRRKGNPTVRKFKPAIGRLEACLIARERDVLSELLARYPDLATASPAPLVPA